MEIDPRAPNCWPSPNINFLATCLDSSRSVTALTVLSPSRTINISEFQTRRYEGEEGGTHVDLYSVRFKKNYYNTREFGWTTTP
jgi:hypothetical protein